MKKTISIFLMGFLFLSTLAACTQDDEIDELFIETETEACCSQEGEIEPPPPPPPPPSGGSGG